jgi:hypothetical protein
MTTELMLKSGHPFVRSVATNRGRLILDLHPWYKAELKEWCPDAKVKTGIFLLIIFPHHRDALMFRQLASQVKYD